MSSLVPTVTVIGGGLAGCEAAWQAAHHGIGVRLYEMRPVRGTEAHQGDQLCELVCSNSFRSRSLETAVGLLKEEMRRLGSLTMEVADLARVPAGDALAVDRQAFAAEVTRRIEAEPLIEVVREEVTELAALGEGPIVVATGPLTSPALYEGLRQLFGRDHLYFYDAISPIVTADSIDRTIAFPASRYGKGGDDYLNCPLDRDQYHHFVDAVVGAEKVPTREFERCIYFEGCMPIEEMARRGRDTLAFGPMRPVGLADPRSGRRPHAVVQLRQDDRAATLYSMVGFQTKMTYPEQRRVFRTIPGLEQAEFVRLGSLHRNTFIHSPSLLEPSLAFVRGGGNLFFAGQLIGVEGYVESAASGLVAGMNAVRRLRGQLPVVPPPTTALGSVLAYVTDRSRRDFQPMNANYGLFPAIGGGRGREKRQALGARARTDLEAWIAGSGLSATGLLRKDLTPSGRQRQALP